MRPPSSLHMESIAQLFLHHAGNGAPDEALARIENDMLAACEAAEALAEGVVAVLADESLEESARIAEARRLTVVHAETAAVRLDAARVLARTELAKLAEIMVSPTGDNSNELKLAAQIRTALRTMPPDQRDFAIQAAIEKNDHVVLVAALGGAAAQIGMTDQDRALHLVEWRRRAFPAEMARHDRLEQAAAAIESAGAAMVGWVGRLTSNPRGAVAEAAME